LKFDELEFLVLDSTKVTDEGLKHIAKLTKLRALWLDFNDITGVGLNELASLENLEDLDPKLLETYIPKRVYKVGLFIPHTYGKPYSQSYIHYLIRQSIAEYILTMQVHEIILTNAGVVPRELEEYWPYVAYDWNSGYETKEIKECYRQVLKERIKDYITHFGKYYVRFAAYLRWNSDSWAALKSAAEELNMEIPNLAPESVPVDQIYEASLGLPEYTVDEDLVLVTRDARKRLREELSKMLQGL
jgi:predicted RNA-binding protein